MTRLIQNKLKKVKSNFGKYEEIPESWTTRSLHEVAKFRQGLQIAKVMRYDKDGPNRIKLIKVLDFDPHKGSNEYIDIPTMRSVICDRDDIIIARTGTIGLVLTDVEGVFHNNTFAIDYDRFILDKMFFFYYLRSPRVQNFIKIISTRTSQGDLTHKEFSHLIIFIPSLGEQKKIALILSNIENLIQKTRQVLEHTQTLKNELIHRLLTKGINQTKFRKSILGEIPEEWEVGLLQDILRENLKNGITKTASIYGSGYPIVEINSLYGSDFYLDYSNLRKVPLNDRELNLYLLKNNDFLINRVSKTKEGAGKLVLVKNPLEKLVAEGNIIRIRVNEKLVFPEYLEYFSKSNIYKQYMQSNCKTLAVTSIDQRIILDVPILLPSLKEQHKIVSILLSVDKLILKLIEKKRNEEFLKKGLMQQLLTGKIRVKV